MLPPKQLHRAVVGMCFLPVCTVAFSSSVHLQTESIIFLVHANFGNEYQIARPSKWNLTLPREEQSKQEHSRNHNRTTYSEKVKEPEIREHCYNLALPFSNFVFALRICSMSQSSIRVRHATHRIYKFYRQYQTNMFNYVFAY